MQKQLLFLFLCTKLCNAQQKKIEIKGKLIDESGVVINAHIINQSNNEGTFSNDHGSFQIYVSLGDSLKISSIQHTHKKVFISKAVMIEKQLNITLDTKTNMLDEVVVKKHQLSGNLLSDIQKTPKDEKAERVEKLVSGIKNMMIKFPTKPVSFYEKHSSRVPIVRPPNTFEGIGVSKSFESKKLKKERALKKSIQEKQEFPKKLLKELTPSFFFKELQIPKENYDHFISFCSSKNIENLYKSKQLFKLIDVLRVESILYLKTIKSKK
ncbi:carboxypeptidase-like regulatory domain-containing protein [Tenacibaculum sp. TC6]|uniref:carboxypeptidase-like regulatory domain-containing protein n=1 Tax=Tenacibaculum sp. TC6 TaxID=3423223 RepID=UPI003D36C730